MTILENLVGLPLSSTKMLEVVYWQWIILWASSYVAGHYESITWKSTDCPRKYWNKKRPRKERPSLELVMPTRMPNWPINIPCTKDKTCLQLHKNQTIQTRSAARKKRNNAKRRNWNASGNEKKRGFKRKKNDESVGPIDFTKIIPWMVIIVKKSEGRIANENIERKIDITIPKKKNLDAGEKATSEDTGIVTIAVAVGTTEKESAVETRKMLGWGQIYYVSIVLFRSLFLFWHENKVFVLSFSSLFILIYKT
jgi:hypothetical protein